MLETVFKIVKTDLAWRTVFYSRAEAGQVIADTSAASIIR